MLKKITVFFLAFAVKAKKHFDFAEYALTKTHCPWGIDRKELLDWFSDYPRTQYPNILPEHFTEKPRLSKQSQRRKYEADPDEDFGDLHCLFATQPSPKRRRMTTTMTGNRRFDLTITHDTGSQNERELAQDEDDIETQSADDL